MCTSIHLSEITCVDTYTDLTNQANVKTEHPVPGVADSKIRECNLFLLENGFVVQKTANLGKYTTLKTALKTKLKTSPNGEQISVEEYIFCSYFHVQV